MEDGKRKPYVDDKKRSCFSNGIKITNINAKMAMEWLLNPLIYIFP